jgi:methylated-DNA-protein-cysteine methyltransferase related protein
MKSNFFEDVYEVARQIPKGRVTSYGAIAAFLGTKGSARMVGWAMQRASEKDVPAHRVVNSSGKLTGKFHFQGRPMEDLLKDEGVMVVDDQIQDFKKHFWDPVKELGFK